MGDRLCVTRSSRLGVCHLCVITQVCHPCSTRPDTDVSLTILFNHPCPVRIWDGAILCRGAVVGVGGAQLGVPLSTCQWRRTPCPNWGGQKCLQDLPVVLRGLVIQVDSHGFRMLTSRVTTLG